ncbi:hypothetical protein D7Y13_36155 [Corallococcus praedator]|uniref:PorV/PorQ family protein n=1 Tax=Corallococcus praedator TaxID=2316724 RepID=A0ABX9Q7G0_9BACT|nr:MULTISPECIES: hypothetical protein [Corallococcus]RKH10462.1 hypothetical protein D7X74_27460 [Corallococcus sp. CA047B]RKH24391.1 hypothetical protein D7X75_32015 [Corallococcus sp. CA031C]RKH92589.1 hypothetical protein D7Y13_36155 [Corallococcus praedator]
MPLRAIVVALSLTLSVVPVVARAAEPAEELRNLANARALGMGSAFRAVGLGADALQGNPAAMVLFPAYRIEGTGAYDPRNKEGFLGISLSDSSSGRLALGVDYHWLSLGRGGSRTTANLSTLGGAIPLSQSLMIGMSGHYLRLNGQSRFANSITLDAGLLVRLGEQVTVGVSGHNLIDTENVELTRYYSAHLGYVGQALVLAADVRGDFETRDSAVLTYNGGAEYTLNQVLPVRVGYTYDGFQKISRLSAGLGFLSPGGGGVDLAYQHDLGGENGRLLVMTLRVSVN